MEKMLAKLYMENTNNIMAVRYYNAWNTLDKYEADDENTYTGNAHGN